MLDLNERLEETDRKLKDVQDELLEEKAENEQREREREKAEKERRE